MPEPNTRDVPKEIPVGHLSLRRDSPTDYLPVTPLGHWALRGKPVNDALGYGVNIEPVAPESLTAGQSYWQAIRVHHLTPEENQGKHHIFLDMLDQNGMRKFNAQARVTWPPDEEEVITVDKPVSEPGANFPMWKWQVCAIEGLGLPSDRVVNLHTNHPDEGRGNTRFRHSFLVVFQETLVEAEAVPSGEIKGRVINGAGRQLVLSRDGQELGRLIVADDEGFRFSDLPAGTYLLAVADTGIQESVTLAPGAAITLTLTIPVSQEPEAKEMVLEHYVLFGPPDALDTRTSLVLALDYVLAFQPVCGFSVEEALCARRVTIIGDEKAVSAADEARIRNSGAIVQRISGDSYTVERVLAERIASGRAFPTP